MRGIYPIAILLAAGFSSVLGQSAPPAPVPPAQAFEGNESQTTAPFTDGDKWEVRYYSSWGICNVSVLAPDGSIVAGGAGIARGAFYVPKGGTYTLKINFLLQSLSAPPQNQNLSGLQDAINQGIGSHGSNGNGAGLSPEYRAQQTNKHWWAEVVQLSSLAVAPQYNPAVGTVDYALPETSKDAAASAPATPSPPAAPSPPPPSAAPAQKMTEDQARAVVLIKGDNAEGTGFLVKTPDGPAVITNIHVIANNPNLKITTNTGANVTVLSEKGASDRDLAMLAIQDAGYSYLQYSTDISKDVQPGDDVITPGNSQGGEVMLNTPGKVLGIGPVRVEIDNPIYHGNSGGPVFHPKSGKVLGVVTEAIKIDVSNDLDKASFASRNSAISGSMRYFGMRIDTVTAWIPIDSRRFQNETAFLDAFHEQSRRLDAYLNHTDADHDEAARLYHADAKIMKANDDYVEHVAGVDTAQHIDLLRSFLFDLQCVADLDMDEVKEKNNFYSFDQERASDEYDYRKALKTELDSLGNNVERLGGLPRSNN